MVSFQGWIYIEDFEGAGFSTFAGMSGDKSMKEMMDAVQNAIPVRLRKVYILNAPWFVRFLMAIVRPFMSKKLQDKCIISTPESLQKEVRPDQLLKQVGGTAEFDYRAWVNKICPQTPGATKTPA